MMLTGVVVQGRGHSAGMQPPTCLYLLSKYDRTKIQIRASFKTLSVETVMLGSFNCRYLWSYCFYRLLSSRARCEDKKLKIYGSTFKQLLPVD